MLTSLFLHKADRNQNKIRLYQQRPNHEIATLMHQLMIDNEWLATPPLATKRYMQHNSRTTTMRQTQQTTIIIISNNNDNNKMPNTQLCIYEHNWRSLKRANHQLNHTAYSSPQPNRSRMDCTNVLQRLFAHSFVHSFIRSFSLLII